MGFLFRENLVVHISLEIFRWETNIICITKSKHNKNMSCYICLDKESLLFNMYIWQYQCCNILFLLKKASQESQNAAQRTLHQLSRCQNVLTKRPFKICHNSSVVTIWKRFCHNMRKVLSQFEFLSFVTIWVWSQFEFFGFNKYLVSEFCHNLSFWVVITIWVFECHPNLNCQVSSQFEFLSFITMSFWVSSQFEFLSFIIIWVEFHHNLVSEFRHNLSFEFHYHLSFWVSS